MKQQHSFWLKAVDSSTSLGSVDRINEVLFGLIMVLTFTCSISAATGGREELRMILWSALGCNVAWGFVDSCMYLFSIMLERGELFGSVKGIRKAASEEEARNEVRQALPPMLTHILKEDHVQYIVSEIRSMPEPPSRVFLTWRDAAHAGAIFLIVFVSTFPVTVPFIFIHDVQIATRASNCVALVLLFTAGVYLARKTGHGKLFTGLIFALMGSVLVFITMALGG